MASLLPVRKSKSENIAYLAGKRCTIQSTNIVFAAAIEGTYTLASVKEKVTWPQ